MHLRKSAAHFVITLVISGYAPDAIWCHCYISLPGALCGAVRGWGEVKGRVMVHGEDCHYISLTSDNVVCICKVDLMSMI